MTVVKEDRLACVERVSRRVTELVRKQKKWEIEGWTRRGVGGGGRKRLPANTRFWKTPLDISRFDSFVN